MKNIAILNNGCAGSTGNIAKNLHAALKEQGYNSVFCYGRGEKGDGCDTYLIDRNYELRWHAFMTRITGLQGFYSNRATARLIKLFKSKHIDTIYIICIHGYYINERMLYDYVAENHIRLIHVMIDEYAYTGKCAYRDDCSRFLQGCGHCPHKKSYPSSYLFDGSSKVFKMKKEVYALINNAIFVGPEFVVSQARMSPLFNNNRIELKILDEAIDMSIYYPRDTSNLKQSLNIESDKIVVCCVVPYYGGGNDRKGGRYFVELARKFEGNPRYVFIHVGYLNKKKENLPTNYTPIGFVRDQNLLAEYFSIGDIFVFPSLLDTMPNACLDALACGTPLLCFDISGMPYVGNSDVATFVEPRNVKAMAEVIMKVEPKEQETIKQCRDYALQRYDSRKYNEKLINIANNS